MSETKVFPLADVLSATTGRLVSRSHIDGIYEILNYMTGDSLFTHQLPRACNECAPVLLAQHPELAEVKVPIEFSGPEHIEAWLVEQETRFGSALPVAPCAAGIHEHRHPIEELRDMVGPEKVFVTSDPDLGA